MPIANIKSKKTYSQLLQLSLELYNKDCTKKIHKWYTMIYYFLNFPFYKRKIIQINTVRDSYKSFQQNVNHTLSTAKWKAILPEFFLCFLFYIELDYDYVTLHLPSSSFLLKLNINNFRLTFWSIGVFTTPWEKVPFWLPDDISTARTANYLILVTNELPFTRWAIPLFKLKF